MIGTLVILLAAAVLLVSLSRRLGFGSIVGYLLGGVLIGPSGLRLVTDVASIARISEFGVLMLLFIIGLELRLPRIWALRRAVFGLGTAQVAVTGAALAGLSMLAGVPWQGAVVLGFGLALSSTAIVLPLLTERSLLATSAGRDAFGVLLFQDIASVPLVALVPVLAGQGIEQGAGGPIWPGLLKAAAAVAAILVGGRFLVRPLFRVVGGLRTPEVFTATALLVVAGAAALAELAGLPMSLGAFAAGVVLAESEYRHELQADVEPFEGLLLGFFFMSVGMSANLALMLAEPGLIAQGVLGLILVKGLIAFAIGRLRGQSTATALRFALALPQGSEFAFVLFGAALAAGALSRPQADRATLMIALTMLISPVLFAVSERFWVPGLRAAAPRRPQDSAAGAKPAQVIICGFGRFGQIVGRILYARRIPFNALDGDAENVDTLRRYGSTVYYGDSTRLDLLRAVGAADAKLLVVALADPVECLRVVELAQRHFPGLRIYARARDRYQAHRLLDAGADEIVRETFFSSLRLTELVLLGLGLRAEDARRTVHTFRERDVQMLQDQHAYYTDEKQLVQTAAQAARELRSLFEADHDE